MIATAEECGALKCGEKNVIIEPTAGQISFKYKNIKTILNYCKVFEKMTEMSNLHDNFIFLSVL